MDGADMESQSWAFPFSSLTLAKRVLKHSPPVVGSFFPGTYLLAWMPAPRSHSRSNSIFYQSVRFRFRVIMLASRLRFSSSRPSTAA